MAFDFFRGEEAFTWNTRGWQAVFNLAETYSSRRIPPTFLSERLRKRESAGNRQFLIRVSPRAPNPQSRPLIYVSNLKTVRSSIEAVANEKVSTSTRR